jgi:hypothetical protein
VVSRGHLDSLAEHLAIAVAGMKDRNGKLLCLGIRETPESSPVSRFDKEFAGVCRQHALTMLTGITGQFVISEEELNA